MKNPRVKQMSECTAHELRARFPAMIFIGLEQLDGNEIETVFKMKGAPEVLQVLHQSYQRRAAAEIAELNKSLQAGDGKDGGTGNVVGAIQM